MKNAIASFAVVLASLFSLANTAVTTTAPKQATKATAIFAGGCFWCMQPPCDRLKAKGVISTSVGYSGGHTDKPTYQQVSDGSTGHKEVIEITYNPQRISYDELLTVFWTNIDPYDQKGQFCDKGEQYQSAIYYQTEDEKKLAQASKEKLLKGGVLKGEVATLILAAKPYFAAEDYHQAYYEKNPIRYKFYRGNCGRDKRLSEVWGKAAAH